jgi:large repetitive protein
MRKHLLFCFILLFAPALKLLGQNYNITNSTVATCGGNFYDSGGNNGQYGNGENFVMTFCSSTSGECVRVSFSSFNIESGYDFLTVYNGASTAAPVLGVYTGTTIPAMITSTTGCLTFEFTSDNIFTNPGWAATISCVPCPGSACPSCNGGAPPSNDACASAMNLGALPTPANCPNGAGAWANFNTTNICATAENPYSSLTGCQPSGNMASPASDVWYRFTITGPTLNIQITGMQTPNLGLYAGTNCNNLIGRGCAVGGGGTLNTSFGGLAPGTYYLQISGGNLNDQCAFSLSLQNSFDCAGCVIQSGLTVNPPPVNGNYQAGQTVTFCYTITDYNQTSVNWLHGVVPTFSAGWDMSTLTTTLPANCSGAGNWGWYNTTVTSTATGQVTGPGFYYESPLGSPSGVLDGNPGNNFGDNNPSNTCDWTFCWTITTASPAVCVPGTSLNITIDTYGDGESGSWTSLACVGDPVTDFFATLTCCIPPVISVTDPLCFGQNTGSATGTGQGTAPWDYVWKNAAGTTIQTANGVNGSNTINNLAPGNYTLTTVDNTNCSSVTSFTITAPTQLVANTVIVPAGCNGSATGSATVNVAGGVIPYLYSWSPSGGSAATASSLAAGTYTVTVTDDNGCTTTAQAIVTQPAGIVLNIVTAAASCGASNGSLTINAAGGSGAIQYSIDNGATFQAGNIFNNLPSGNYNIVVTDATGCQATTTAQVNNSVAPVITTVPVIDALCNGDANGSITINANGGTGALNYSINNGGTFQPSSTFNNLAAGNYSIVVEDANGCQATFNVTVAEPPIIIVNLSGVNPVCGVDNGSITVNASGGTGTLLYSIDGGANQPAAIFNNLNAANHSVTVTDGNNCTATASFTLGSAPVLTINGNSTSATCGSSDGSVTTVAAGGTAAYQYSLNGGTSQLSGTFNNLAAGSYDITVTDANGCTATVNLQVAGLPGPTITSSPATDANCNSEASGSITINTNGGTPAIQYSINGGAYQSSNIFNNLPAGSYTITVTDANGCTSTSNATVNEPPAISAPWSEQPSTCGNANGTLTVNGSGGSGALTYSVNGGAFQSNNIFNNLLTGSYSVTVQDANGCTVNTNATITDVPGPTVTSVNTVDINCNGGSTGTITVNANGGTGTLSYMLNGGTSQSSNIFTGLTAGAYTVTVTDANSCTVVSSVNLLESTPLVLNSVPVASTCGNANGSATVNASGATPAYQFSLNGGPSQAAGTFTLLAAGSYTVIVTDANGCSATDIFSVTDQASPVIASSNVTDASCFGGNDGAVSATISGGLAPVDFTLNGGPSQSTGNFTGLVTGSYTVTATDANGCSASVILQVNEPAEIIVSGTPVTSTCGNANGSITLNANGGTGALTYNINGGTFQSSPTFGGLLAGSYDLVTTDINGCQVTTTILVTDEPAPAITSVPVTDASCMGASDATLTINATGGTGSLTYSIDNGATSQPSSAFTNLPAGNYNIVVTDANGCTVTSQVVINQPTPLNITTAPIASTCSSSNGSVTVNASGGTPVYSYSLNGGAAQASNIFNNLTQGNYDVTVTDQNGCLLQVLFSITDLPGPVITNTPVTDVTCNGGNDGTAIITINSGTAPLSFSLNGGTAQPTGNFNTLPAGNYQVVVTDANGCSTSGNFSINEPAILTASGVPAVSTCGNSNGSLTINAVGGISPYQFSLNGGAQQASGSFSGLPAGTYDIVVTDNNGCTATVTVNVTDEPAPAITTVPVTNISCNGGNDGSITINTSGGTGALIYSIDNGSTTQGTSIFTNLTAGTYDIIVTDNNGCTVTSQSVLTEPTMLTGSGNSTPASCGNSDGSLTVQASGGTPTYQYSINNGSTNQASGVFSNLIAAGYDILVTDQNGCTATINVAVSNTSAPVISSVNLTDLTCFNSDDGTITVNANSGVAPLTYSINNGSTFLPSGVFSNLPAGTYDIVVSDAVGCQANSSVTIIQPALLTVATVNINTTCSNANGSITVNAAGGSTPYNYSVNGGTGQSGNVFSNISAGSYSVLITDANGCTATSTENITDASSPVIQNISTTDISCNGGTDGAITISSNGGTGILQFSIDGGNTFQSSNIFNNLLPGSYNIIVTDINGCTSASTQVLTQPIQISFSTSSTAASCGNSDGSLTINASGGTGVLTYSINNGSTYQQSPVFNNIQAGSYQVIVQDNNGCTSAANANVNNAAAPVITATSFTDIDCFGAANGTITITASGGTGTLQFSNDNGATYQAGNTFSNLIAGTYNLVVEDINGCQATSSVIIAEPLALQASVNGVNTTCGNSNGSLSVSGSGGTGNMQYSIDNGVTFQQGTTFNNLPAGSYTVIVQDANGCTSGFLVSITDAPGPQIQSATATDITCNGDDDGTINISGNGGTGALEYSIDNGANFQATAAFTALPPGSYTIVIRDVNGCTATTTVLIAEPATVTFTTTDTPASCGNSDGSLTITASGGTGPFSYSIDNGATYQLSNTFTGIASGSYNVAVQDANGCTETAPAAVSNAAAPVITATAATDITCNGDDDGTISISASGGTGTLLYSINNGATFQAVNNFSNLPPGNYDLIVEDVNGCQAASTVTILEPAAITATFNTLNTTCSANNGSIDIDGTGGTGVLQYSITNGSTFQVSDIFNNISAGIFQVVLQDDNGCQSSFPVTITDSPSPVIQSTLATAVNCYGDTNGVISINAPGGTAPLQYSIDNGSTLQSANVFNNLAPATYNIFVTDANGCTATSTATITEPAEITGNFLSTTATCGNSDGTLTINASGGTGSLQYSINNGVTYQSSPQFTFLTAGTYPVIVRDVNGCTATIAAAVNNAAAPAIQNSNVTAITCNGAANGIINISASGGTGALLYSIDNGSTTQAGSTFSNLPPGIYNIVVTDVNGCSAIDQVVLTEPSQVTATAAATTATCSLPNGSITITAQGGTGNLTYSVNGGTSQSSNTFNSLASGPYNITVTDANGCTYTLNSNVQNAPGPVMNLLITTDITCNGYNDGSITILVNGGSNPIQYSIDNGTTFFPSGNFSALGAGTYNIVASDLNGCTVTSSASITQPAAINISQVVTDANCGNSDGSITINASGGNGAFSYSINNGVNYQPLNTFTSLPAGTYTVVVRDGNDCTTSVPVTVNNSSAPVILATPVTNVSCNGIDDGALTIQVSGGISPLSYSVNGGFSWQSTGNFINLPAGIYDIIVSDVNGCESTTQDTITEPAAINLNTTTTTASCGNNDGSATITVNGGSGTYQYSLNNGPQQATGIFSNLAAGNYNIVVTDASGCSESTVASVNNTNAPVITLVTGTDISCFGDLNGTISITATGGTGALQYSIDNSNTFQSMPQFSNLAAGTYSIVVEDLNGCIATSNFDIIEPDQLVVNGLALSTTCGNSNGEIQTLISGGTGTIQYSIDNGNTYQPAGIFTALPQGPYTIFVTDANGCTATDQVTLNNIAGPAISTLAVNNSSCNGSDDGSLQVTITGGTGPFLYNLNGGSSQSSAYYGSLTTGAYTIMVTDANGCSSDSVFNVTQPTAVSLNVSGSNSTCSAANGSITLVGSGGTGAYTYSSNGGISYQASGIFSSLLAGSYTAVVQDANGCLDSAITIVADEPGPIIQNVTVTDVSCNGIGDGTISISASGGTAPFQYSVNNGNTFQALPAFTNLSPGAYDIIITDANGCSAVSSAAVIQPATLLTSVSSTAALCNGSSDGTATITVMGGTSPYSFNWSAGGSSQTSSGLAAGIYTVTVTDSNGCTSSAPVTVNEPAAVAIQGAVGDISCNGFTDGSLQVILSGGTAPYNYQWSSSNVSGTGNNGLAAGSYTLTVTDDNGCSLSQSYTITEPALLTLSATSSAVSCFGNSNGSATATALGGTAPYSYVWSNNSTTATATSLVAGTYTVTVTDAHGCSDTVSQNILSPLQLTVSDSATDVTCNGSADGTAMVIASGGTQPYSYIWNNGASTASVLNLDGGTFTVIVTDANNCSASSSVTIAEPTPVNVTTTGNTTICIGQSTIISGSAQGGNGGYSYNWSNGWNTSSQSVNPGVTATYTLTVTDSLGCTGTGTAVIVNVNVALSITISPADTICEGESAMIQAQASGGDGGPYTYTWSGLSSTSSQVNVSPAGTTTYTVTVSDGCGSPSAGTSVQILVNPLPVPAFTPVPAEGCAPLTVFFDNNSITASASASYQWDFGDNNSSVATNPVHLYETAGFYTVTLNVTSAEGCTSSITVPDAVKVYPLPEAAILATPPVVSILHPEIFFTDNGYGASGWTWDFGYNSLISNEQNTYHNYEATGIYNITLYVTNDYGCADTAYAEIIVEGASTVYIPNAFSPNDDGINDIFSVYGTGLTDISMSIFNRWGNKVFLSSSEHAGWNGTDIFSGAKCPVDVYIYLVKAKNLKGEVKEYTGRVTLID